MEVPKRNKKEWKVKITEHRKVTAYESTFGPNHKLLREIRLQETDHIISVFQTLQIQRKKNYQLDIV